jgi:CRP-like cAMP-binding protein
MHTPTAASVHELTVGSTLTKSLGTLETVATMRRFDVGEPIYLCGQPAEFWYRIEGGAGRKCAFTFDGDRQIVDFLQPGDLFGFDAQEVHEFSVEAIVTGTAVARYPKRSAERITDSEPEVARQIRKLAFESIARVQKRVVILGRATPLEKVSAFLLEMADRFCARSPGAVILPMSRYDIADYLALAAETVSRALTHLRESGAIRLAGVRRVQICDRRALETLSRKSRHEINTGRVCTLTPRERAQAIRARAGTAAKALRPTPAECKS